MILKLTDNYDAFNRKGDDINILDIFQDDKMGLGVGVEAILKTKNGI